MERKIIINLFIRFLKENGVYGEYKIARKDVDVFLNRMTYRNFIVSAFDWFRYPKVDWGDLHAQWNEVLYKYEKLCYDLERTIY